MSPSNYDCSFSARSSELEPYGDVAGPGVLAGFLGPGWLSVGLVLLHYIFVFDPNKDPFLADGQEGSDCDDPNEWKANPIDSLVKDVIGKGLRCIKINTVWGNALEMSILGMCDVQFVTGIGILISGFIDLRKGISAYHFYLITHVAWFSNLTHICGLAVLRKYLHSRPIEKVIRLWCMATLAILLLIAMGPTLFFNWAYIDPEGSASLPGTDAICFYNPSRSASWFLLSKNDGSGLAKTTAFQSGLTSILLLFLNFTSRMIKFQKPLSDSLKALRRLLCGNLFKSICLLQRRRSQTTGLRSLFNRRMMLYNLISLLLVLTLYLDLLLSSLWDMFWLLASAFWGTFKLFMTKSSANVDEDDWNFGQILPAFLLLGPIATAIKAAFEHQLESTRSQSSYDTRTLETGHYGLANNESTVTDALDDSTESLEMLCFQEHMENCLKRNYYDPKTCRWMPWVVFFACLQVLAITIMAFATLVNVGPNVRRVLLSSLFNILVIIPSTTYMLVITCIIYEIYGPARGRSWIFTIFLISVSGAFVIYPLWEVLGNFAGTPTTGTATSSLVLISGGIMAIAASGVCELLLFAGGKD
ncbi:hypothetical protein KAF25_003701 [Fusarium avenaceum]|uniref:Uncharacterized protein n=1 Tax=Fusarium avenaceum TaxID=40199 RepID=A0A9P7KSF5_9HYPO|nr:hypothetical protein KAF25_003701 [Fusarium avenaceum]